MSIFADIKYFDDHFVWAFESMVNESVGDVLDLSHVINLSIASSVYVPHDLVAHSCLANYHGTSVV